jgi:mercuric ion transport protein
MNPRKLLGIGLGGTILAAICCFTPALVILLGALGLSSWLGWLDFVLLPSLTIFLGITAYAAFRLTRKPSADEPGDHAP